MEPDSRLAEIRRQLLVLVRRRSARKSQWTATRPTDWRPTQVTDPRSGTQFTEDGAWEFVGDELEAGRLIEEIVLKQPPGKKAYVMKIPLASGRTLYVKLELGAGKVLGRSFHYSAHDGGGHL